MRAIAVLAFVSVWGAFNTLNYIYNVEQQLFAEINIIEDAILASAPMIPHQI